MLDKSKQPSTPRIEVVFKRHLSSGGYTATAIVDGFEIVPGRWYAWLSRYDMAVARREIINDCIKQWEASAGISGN